MTFIDDQSNVIILASSTFACSLVCCTISLFLNSSPCYFINLHITVLAFASYSPYQKSGMG